MSKSRTRSTRPDSKKDREGFMKWYTEGWERNSRKNRKDNGIDYEEYDQYHDGTYDPNNDGSVIRRHFRKGGYVTKKRPYCG